MSLVDYRNRYGLYKSDPALAWVPGDLTAPQLGVSKRVFVVEDKAELQTALGIKANETVTFARLDESIFQDGVRFANGSQTTLQRLVPGIKAEVIDALVVPYNGTSALQTALIAGQVDVEHQ